MKPQKCSNHILEILGYYDDNPGLLIWGCRRCGVRIRKREDNEEDNIERGESLSIEDFGRGGNGEE